MSENSRVISLGSGATDNSLNNKKRRQRTSSYLTDGKDKLINSIKDSLQVATTVITTTATKINTPDDTSNFTIYHETEGTIIAIGDSTVTTSTRPRLENGDVLEVSNFELNNANELYGIVSVGNITIYAVGTIKL